MAAIVHAVSASGVLPSTRDGSSGTPAGLTNRSPQELEEIARAFDAIGDDVRASLGEPDAAYIRRVIATQRRLELAARGVLLAARGRRGPTVIGAMLLAVAKALENMEIGHNVMHGQWDWMQDPDIHSSTWEWDAVSTARSWKHSHNYQHHTFTNVLGRDRDLGYSAMRVDADQAWHPVYLLQPLYGLGIAAIFEWGIALYDMELDAVRRGEKTREQAAAEVRAFAAKAARQLSKDFLLYPALSRRSWRGTLLANLAANVARNLWVHTIVFMGHIPEGAVTFTEEQMAGESRGGWYVRQILGSCNLEGRPLFHLMTGNLSYQIEHHLFPDLPSSRYAEIAPRVRAVCAHHGLPYNSGRLGRQYLSVARKIARLSLPGGGNGAAGPALPLAASATAS
jgi:fatty acid desaturase